jgi:hypothetical protein
MSEIDPFLRAVVELERAAVRFVLIGVAGANYYGRSGAETFMTLDRDVFLPCDAANELRAWEACRSAGLGLWCGGEPLDEPRDLWLAERVVAHRALVRATDGGQLQLDLTLVMAGHEFEPVWQARRTFIVRGVEIPVARLTHIVVSKARADRPKDRLFLATYAEALAEWMKDDDEPGG